MSLANLHQSLAVRDREILEKKAAEEYQRGEEEACGQIMARGFMDELTKLADWGMPTPQSIPSKPMQTGGGNTGAGAGGMLGGRKASAPPAPPPPAGSVTGGKGATMKDAKGTTFNTATSTKPAAAKPPGIGGK